jgi:hypothetical protein
VRTVPTVALATFVVVGLAACEPASPSTTTPTGSGATTASPVPRLPAGLPPAFQDDVPAADVPAAALIPLKTTVTGTWYGVTSAGETMVVAWQAPGDDPFRVGRGVAAWRRFDDGGSPWRPVWGAAYPARDMVVAIDATTGDVTGDGSDDAIVAARSGNAGVCATYTVLDLATVSTLYELQDVCDVTLEPDPDLPGLLLTRPVYAPGDAHCCPSDIMTSRLTYDDGGWTASDETSAAP